MDATDFGVRKDGTEELFGETWGGGEGETGEGETGEGDTGGVATAFLGDVNVFAGAAGSFDEFDTMVKASRASGSDILLFIV
jgi:hypothetical protein